jgi:hypothetical protein
MMCGSPVWLTTANTLDRCLPSEMAGLSIQAAMPRLVLALTVLAGCIQAQTAPATPTATPVTPAATANDGGPQRSVAIADTSSEPVPGRKVGLVRGVVKRLDPIRDQLLIHAFGGGDLRIAFDGRTQLFSENTRTRLTSIPVGSVVSVDTVIDGGKLFARAVRTGSSDDAAELSGQVVGYNAAKSRLTLRDPISPEGVSLRITSSTTVVSQGQPASPQALSPGMLVRVWFSPTQSAANKVEILAERGNSFTFEGRIIAVDLRSHVLSLSNDTDQSVRQLDIGSLDANTLGLLREGADVNIQAEFDGERYNVSTVAAVPSHP